MQVTVHEHVGKSLALLIEGASDASVADAFWNGLKREINGRMLAIGQGYISRHTDGTLVLRCEPNTGVADLTIVRELEFQLNHYPVAATA